MKILCYTREAEAEEIYAKRLGAAMHLAWFDEADRRYHPLHHNEGILYAKAVSLPDGTLRAKSLKNPRLFRMPDGSFAVLAVRTEAEGEEDSQSLGCVLCFTSPDLVHYREEGLIAVMGRNPGKMPETLTAAADDAAEETVESAEILDAVPGSREMAVRLQVKTKNGRTAVFTKNNGLRADFPSGMTGAVRGENAAVTAADEKLCEAESADTMKAGEETGGKNAGFEACVPGPEETSLIRGYIPGSGNVIEIQESQAEYLLKKLRAPVCVRMETEAGEAEVKLSELSSVRAKALYSDGTCVLRKVDWEFPEPDQFSPDGSPAVVRGRVCQEHFDFPFAGDRADPCCMMWQGKYYFIATSEHDQNRSLYVRCADRLDGLAAAEQKLILDTGMYPEIGNLLWAPEFHEINGDLYIFFAATEGEFYREESRVMKLAPAGDPSEAADWSRPQLVVRKDGTPLCEAGKVISLDMTEFQYNSRYYAVWSQRQFLPVDQGAWLMAAEIDPNEPWKLLTDPVCICKPVYGWENNHTFVTEGPYALVWNGRLMLTYSGALVDTTYTVGMLKLKEGAADPTNPDDWEKSNYALMSSASCEGEYGPGHNSYLIDKNGLVWNFYHARPGVKGPRSSGMRRVHFDTDGEPMLDVTEDKDLPEKFRTVEVRIVR
ncbi:MAG: family 43 glycosylhydrolase [Lachnospiraceae bacterium]|jgi:GH43 family beta-xylosidase